ncbi:MAG: fibronectin type III domain-containing protein, partial [Brevinema sp.]
LFVKGKLFASIALLILCRCSSAFLDESGKMERFLMNASYNKSYLSIVLSWDIQEHAVSYEVLRGISPHHLSTLHNNVITTQLEDNLVIPGKEYYYQIKAYSSQHKIIAVSQVSRGLRSYYPENLVTAPEDVKISQSEYNDKIVIKWAKKEDFVYRIYRSLDKDGDFKSLAFVYSTEFNDFDVSIDSTFYYKIATIACASPGKIVEKEYPHILEGSLLQYPTGLEASQNDLDYVGKIKINWDINPKVSYYHICRSTEYDGEYKIISYLVSGNQFIDDNLPSYKEEIINGRPSYQKYFYRIRAIRDGQLSYFSKVAVGTTLDPLDILEAPKNLSLQLDKSVFPYLYKISWDPVLGAGSYQISFLDDSSKSPITLSKSSFSLPALDVNQTLKIMVQAINQEDSLLLGKKEIISYTRRTPSPPIDLRTTTNHRIQMTNIKAVQESIMITVDKKEFLVGCITKRWEIKSQVGMVNLSWKHPQEPVDYYRIYRSVEENGTYRLIGESKNLYFSDTFFTDKEYKRTYKNGKSTYPFYYYKITTVFAGEESMPSFIQKGSAIDPEDIMPLPSYLTIPFHWASGTGYGDMFSSITKQITAGNHSPKGIEQISSLSDRFNFLYLTWDTVPKATKYIVGFSKGNDAVIWKEKSSTQTYFRFNNENLDEGTGLYKFTDWLSYSADSATFQVTAIYQKDDFLISGDTIGLLFEEPDKKPSVY